MQIITFEDGWTKVNNEGILKLQSVIKNMSNKDATNYFTNTEYVALYTTIYQMCIQKSPYCYTPELYDAFRRSIQTYLESVVLPEIRSRQGEHMVKELVRRWEDHKLMKKWLVDFFRYLDRFYVKRYSREPLEVVCIERFKFLIFEVVKAEVTVALLELIEKDRKGEQVDRDLLRSVIQIYVEMGMDSQLMYLEEFEKPFMQATSEFYSREAANWLGADSCPEYLRKAEVCFSKEKRRLMDYLHSSSETRLMSTLYQAVLITHQSAILGKETTGCKAMLEAHAENDIARMYNLYNCVPSSLDPISSMVKSHIVEIGQALISKVNESKDNTTFVEELMKIHDKYYNLVLTCFRGNNIFQKALKDAFETIVNKGTATAPTAELLAEFTDTILKKGGSKLEEKALEDTLDNTVRLFTYLSDKDLFSEFYRKLLSKRLLLQNSESIDAEKSMIGKLKLKCGSQYTSKLEGMIIDMRSAQDHEIGFKEFVAQRQVDLGNIDFTVQTLTSGFWPTYQPEELKLAGEMKQCIDAFMAYYNTKTNNRVLRWIHRLGTVTMTGNFVKRKIDLVVSAVQAAILMLFNEFDSLSIDAIIAHTALDADSVKTQLRSLVSGKFKILNKEPEAGYATTHLMSVNKAFTHQQRRIKIPNAMARTTAKDRGAATLAVTEDRRHAIEAAIVRVMKTRKTLEHQKLVIEVSTHLLQYFKPDPRQIKQRIQDLIGREYLERDENNSNLYHYVA